MSLLKDWMKNKTFKMVTLENITEVIDSLICSPFKACAIDLEATGLDIRVFNKRTRHQITGFCLCGNDLEAFYLPVGHRGAGEKHNIPWSVAYEQMQRLFAADLSFIYHNGKFDHELLQYNGFGALGGAWDKADKWEDTMILSYLENSKRFSLSLKEISKEDLGLEMIEYDEITNYNRATQCTFDELDPSDPNVLGYACGDAMCTFLIFRKKRNTCLKLGKLDCSQEFIYRLEKMTMTATRWMERCRILVDLEKVKELTKEAITMYFEVGDAIYKELEGLLGRDVTSISYLVLRDMVKEKNPEFLPFKKSDPRCFISMKKASKLEGDRVKRSIGKGAFFQMTYPKEYVSACLEDKGKTYNISSPSQLGDLLLELKVPDLKFKEKSGKVATGKGELDEVISKHLDRFPFLKSISKFREIDKSIGTYLIPIFDGANEGWGCLDCGVSFSHNTSECCPSCKSTHIFRDASLHVSFMSLGTETGRFKVKEDKNTGNGRNKKDDSYEKTGQAKVFVHGIPSTLDIKKIRPMRELRYAFIARPGYIMIAADYAGVELRLATSLSREPLWEEEYFKCAKCGHQYPKGEKAIKYCYKCGSLEIGDLHSRTCVGVYGEEARKLPTWKQLRGYAKGGNFSMAYGGGPSALVRSIKCSLAEAKRFYNKFIELYVGLAKWWEEVKNFAREHQFVLTRFNRKYPVPDILHEDGKIRSKSERNCTNSPVQGLSADVTKIAMSLSYVEFLKRGWINLENPALDKVRLIITMHDELVFEVKEELAQEFVSILRDIMVDNIFIKNSKMVIPLAIDMDIGKNWDGDFSYYPCLYNVEDWPEEYAHLFPVSVAESKKYHRFSADDPVKTKVFNLKRDLSTEDIDKLVYYLYQNLAKEETQDKIKLKIYYRDVPISCFDGMFFKTNVEHSLEKLE